MDAARSGAIERRVDAAAAGGVAPAGPVGGDDAAVGGVRAGDVRAEGAEVWGVSAEWLVPVVDGEDDGERDRRGGPVTRERVKVVLDLSFHRAPPKCLNNAAIFSCFSCTATDNGVQPLLAAL